MFQLPWERELKLFGLDPSVVVERPSWGQDLGVDFDLGPGSFFQLSEELEVPLEGARRRAPLAPLLRTESRTLYSGAVPVSATLLFFRRTLIKA